MQSGPPSLQLRVQALNSRGFQRKGERMLQKAGGLFLRETEVSSTYFVQDIASTHSCQGKGGIAACDQDHMERGWEMIQDKGDRFVDLGRADHMIILQNQDPS